MRLTAPPVNQTQRGHQHITELHADAYGMLLSTGLFYPRESAMAGLLYAVGILLYGVGYSIKPQYRVAGEILYLPGMLWHMYLLYKAGSALWSGTPL